MKAIVMAGGEGVRLAPLTTVRPKPMMQLFGRPVLEHIINLLRENGITDICLTLHYMARSITSYFGDGSAFGVRLEYRVETKPLGTAGSVKSCQDFLGGEDALIISGDCVCDFDLRPCMHAHQTATADATFVLYRHPSPLEYGLVVTEPDGRITQFVEKPAWDRVFTDQINTGIYILSPTVLQAIPEQSAYDFGQDLFPKLLQDGKPLYGILAEGYWCDIGNPQAYLQCCRDVLDGKVRLPLAAPGIQEGVWIGQGRIDPTAKLIPPVYVAPDVTIGAGASVGPYAMLERGSYVGADAVVQKSLVLGGSLHSRSRVSGAIVDRHASIGAGSVLEEDTVVGANTILGGGSVVAAGVKIWPGRQIHPGSRVADTITEGMQMTGLLFDDSGCMTGQYPTTVSPQTCLAMGTVLGGQGRVAVGFTGGEAARILAEAFACGITAGGGTCCQHDSTLPSAAAYVCQAYDCACGVFVQQAGSRVVLRFSAPDGKLSRALERKLESANQQESGLQTAQQAGRRIRLTGTMLGYQAAAAAGHDSPKTLYVSVPVADTANRLLRQVLEETGCQVQQEKIGLPEFVLVEDGFLLQGRDELGRAISPEQMLVLAVISEFSAGSGQAAVPYDAPVVLDVLANQMGTRLYRLGRDPAAERLYREQRFLRDGLCMAAHLCKQLREMELTLSQLYERLPSFSFATREIYVTGDRGRLMRDLAASYSEMAMEQIRGLRWQTDRGWVHVTPCGDRPVLRIRSESEQAEIAEELAEDIWKAARKLERT